MTSLNATQRQLLELQEEQPRRLRLIPVGDVIPVSLKVNPPSKKIDIGLACVKDNLKEISECRSDFFYNGRLR